MACWSRHGCKLSGQSGFGLDEEATVGSLLRVTEALSFVALGSVVVAFAAGWLTFTQICVVSVVVVTCGISYSSALTALLKQSIAEQRQLAANIRLSSVDWTTATLGPVLGGLLITAVGVLSSVTVDAVSFAVAAVILGRRFVGEHAVTDVADPGEKLRTRVTAGLRHICRHQGLRRLYTNAMLFGGALSMTTPLLSIFMLATLHLSALEYGVGLGAPGAAGLIGSLLSTRLVRRFGTRVVLLTSGAARGPCLLPLAIAPRGLAGLAVVVGGWSLLLFTAGVFNPLFYSYRMKVTPSEIMTRVVSAWSVSNKTVTPLFIAAGGWLATIAGVRVTIFISATLCIFSAIFMPWHTETP